MIPATSNQLLILVAVVLPGIVFGTVLQRLRGPMPEDRDVGTRILRAVAVGVGLDLAYVLIGGSATVDFFMPSSADSASDPRFITHPREAAVWALLLIGVVPSVLALVVHASNVLRDAPSGTSVRQRLRRLLRTTYRTTPTAWDYAARRRGDCFVRVRLTDGEYIGGWVAGSSYVSGYPEPRDIYISSQWAVNEQGVFLYKIPETLGFYLAIGDGVLVEWMEKPAVVNVAVQEDDTEESR